MTRFTVTAVPGVEDDLVRIWMHAPNGLAVSEASNTIDRLLKVDPQQQGQDAGEGLRQLIVPPLIAKFTVKEDDRLVTIWSISHVGTITNGY
jgi:hypothetical protein